ncbi:hypothetical protein [Siphonobacter sp. SORGH_AS_1065]|uniref:hypothetical protein n=1 Tax=Siphonobacter sp. SORGH_AS_1065 TaxID=3041795 RepID=UPI002788E7DE|nr:hypothetical protein [Siphonobacter sp. SORGH_AS_1065]MDQ1087007.1 hypothetical protein [Siphonobacter sp. SORGH_AS_1065]
MSQVGFLPWVGDKYFESKPRILILGESHYGQPEDYSNDFTQWVVNEYAVKPANRLRFFTTIANTITGHSGWMEDEKRSEFWHSVAFYNYIQELVGTGARIRPSDEMWVQAQALFFETLTTLKPEIVIVLGKELSWYVQDALKNKVIGETHFCYWAHPAAPKYFKKEEYFKEIQEVKSRFKS